MSSEYFEAVTRADDARDAYHTLIQQVMAGSERMRHGVGHRGGHENVDVYWHPHAELWIHLQVLKGRYWCRYGLQNPHVVRSHLLIACEANPPRAGKDWTCAGAFARDAAGAMYYMHSGKLGGGCLGVGRAKFLAAYHDPVVEVGWPDGTQRSMIMLGTLESPGLIRSIAQFARQVDDFKCAMNPCAAARRRHGQPRFDPLLCSVA